MKKKLISIAALLLMLSVMLSACADGETVGTESGTESESAEESVEIIMSDVERVELEGSEKRDGGDGSELQVLKGSSEEAYKAYCKELESQGFAPYAKNTLGANSFATYQSNKSIVNVMFYGFDGSLRVATDSKAKISLPAKEAQFSTACDPLFFSVGLASDTETKNKNGLCYIFRLSDGSFIVYDGGWDARSNRMADKIMKVLEKNAPNPDNIVISAWVITHAHSDHVGGFINFTSMYRDNVTVKNILLSNASEDFQAAHSMTSKVTAFNDSVSKYMNASLIKAHPGQKLVLADAAIEVFYTMDLYDAATLHEYNATSIVTRVTIGGQTFMMTGDMDETDASQNGRHLVDMYGDALKSDFVQVSHHGYEGLDVAFYRQVKAKYVIWPASKVGYEEMKNKERNSLFKSLTSKELIVARDNIATVTLPYDGKSVTYTATEEYLK